MLVALREQGKGIMKHTFHVVDITVFDVHTTVKPLIIKDCVRPELSFLVNEHLYRQQHQSRAAIETADFRIKPLKYSSRQYTYFWKNYLNVWPEKWSDYWKLQIPFTCEPRGANLSVIDADTDIEIKLRPVIYLSALGWSTHLTLQLKGDMKLEQVRSLIGKLRSKDEDGQIFRLKGENVSLSGVFKYLSERMRETLYKPNRAVSEKLDETNVHRHFVVSLTNFSGAIYYYKSKWWHRDERMTNADQATLHSILHGRPIPVKEFAYLTRDNKFSLIHFKGPDLALSYFNLGTLIFLQQSAAKSSRRVSMQCLASNITNCSMMSLMFLYFHGQATKLGRSNPLVGELLKYVEEGLQRMPERYTNKFCEKLFSNHSDLMKLRAKPSVPLSESELLR